jgi:hypothetical protein
MLKEEKIFEVIDLLKEKDLRRFRGFTPMGQHIVGIRKITAATPIAETYEIGPKGPEKVMTSGLGVRVTYAHTPHHSKGIFGYWHINDQDEIFIPIMGKEPGTIWMTILFRTPRPDEGDKFAWFCRQCNMLLCERYVNTGRVGMGGFWIAEKKAVEGFNRDPKLRTCRNCGVIHPLAYTYWDLGNAEEVTQERIQRVEW